MTTHWTEAIKEATLDISARLVGMADALAESIAADEEHGRADIDGQRRTAFRALARALQANATLIGETTNPELATEEALKMVRVARAILIGEDPEQHI